MDLTATIPVMGRKPSTDPKKKPTGGKHKNPRTPLQLPTPWLVIARRLARSIPQPTNWYVVGLLEREAKAKGMTDLPPLPWEEEENGSA